MSPDDLAPRLRSLRRTPLLPLDASASGATLGRADVEALVPHRGSMLLLDGIDLVRENEKALRARRRVDPDDPVLVGHFPGSPVYPGVLLIEMMGQAGLCLLPLLGDHAAVLAARLTHVHHATFLAPVLPGDELVVLAALLDESLTLTAVGQVYRGSTLCAYAISEVYLAD